MATIPGTNIPAKIAPFTTDDQYPTHEDVYGLGGMMTVADITARDAIPASRRKQYMKVAVIADGVTYELSGGVENSNWKPFGPIYYQQATEPTVAEKTFVFWRNSTANKFYLVTKINSSQRKVELTSTSWQTVTSPRGGVSVAWSPSLSLLVAVNSIGVMTSSDGVNWTARSCPSNAWNSVCWSPERSLFVAVSYSSVGNIVMTSPDGINWTSRTSVANSLWSVTWSSTLGLFVAVGQSGTTYRVMTSPDGVTWTGRTSASSCYSVVWSPEKSLLVAVGYNVVASSPDGINWTVRNTTSNEWRSVTWSPQLGLFVAVANTNNSSQIMTSPDGITWTLRTAANTNGWWSVTWSPTLGLFVAVSLTGTEYCIMTSSNGITWIEKSAPNLYWYSIIWTSALNLFVAVGDSNVMISSTGS